MKKKVLLYKTPTKPLSFYRAMTAEQREAHVQERVNKLHELNDKRTFALQEDEDLKLTSLGHYDVDYRCDLYSICL